VIVFGAQLLAAAVALATPQQTAQPTPHYPFSVGERAEYQIGLGWMNPGSASLELRGIDTVRGQAAYHFSFTILASELGYHIRDTLQSWADTAHLESVRFHQDQHEGITNRPPRVKRYEIFPDRQMYQDGAKPEQPSVSNPLDDVSFLYFVRTQKLEVGHKYLYQNYFKPESNPVTLEVLRKDTITVPAGRFVAFVVRPVIKTSGFFSEGGKALIWISDDSARMVVQLYTKLANVAPLTMQLKSFRPSAGAPTQRGK
jgi:hypothetical protein